MGQILGCMLYFTMENKRIFLKLYDRMKYFSGAEVMFI